MTTAVDAARSISRRFEHPSHRIYARMKIASDPLYEAALAHLRDTALPVFDLGCGLGILGLFLRERGVTVPVTGIDTDRPKVEAARRAASNYSGLTVDAGDARDALSTFSGNVVMLDLLHYLTDAEQSSLLRDVARAVAPGGVAIIRECIRDGSWRYRATLIEETFAKTIGWLRVPRLNFPTIATLDAAFEGFAREMTPMWGRTPFNNYMLVYRRT